MSYSTFRIGLLLGFYFGQNTFYFTFKSDLDIHRVKRSRIVFVCIEVSAESRTFSKLMK